MFRCGTVPVPVPVLSLEIIHVKQKIFTLLCGKFIQDTGWPLTFTKLKLKF